MSSVTEITRQKFIYKIGQLLGRRLQMGEITEANKHFTSALYTKKPLDQIAKQLAYQFQLPQIKSTVSEERILNLRELPGQGRLKPSDIICQYVPLNTRNSHVENPLKWTLTPYSGYRTVQVIHELQEIIMIQAFEFVIPKPTNWSYGIHNVRILIEELVGFASRDFVAPYHFLCKITDLGSHIKLKPLNKKLKISKPITALSTITLQFSSNIEILKLPAPEVYINGVMGAGITTFTLTNHSISTGSQVTIGDNRYVVTSTGIDTFTIPVELTTGMYTVVINDRQFDLLLEFQMEPPFDPKSTAKILKKGNVQV